jgi:hypothetical protein
VESATPNQRREIVAFVPLIVMTTSDGWRRANHEPTLANTRKKRMRNPLRPFGYGRGENERCSGSAKKRSILSYSSRPNASLQSTLSPSPLSRSTDV